MKGVFVTLNDNRGRRESSSLSTGSGGVRFRGTNGVAVDLGEGIVGMVDNLPFIIGESVEDGG